MRRIAMRIVCYVCREEREAREIKREGKYVLVVCERGHQQFIPRSLIYE